MERSIGEALGGDEGEKSLARERIEKEEAGSVGEVRHSESSMPTLWKYLELELRHRNVREAEFFFEQRQRCGQSKLVAGMTEYNNGSKVRRRASYSTRLLTS